jgi:predicted ATPase
VLTVIGGRLAQLPASARELASLAATIGRDFTFAVLAAASERNEEAVARDLDDLWQRRLVREQGGEDYDFSHDKIREVAAGLVSAGHRRLLHRRIAQALEQVYRADLDPRSHDIAAHYDQAGLAALAIPYYQRAAAVAQALYANEEAVTLLNKALAALAGVPAGSERAELELALQTALGVPLLALKGYSAPDVRAVYIRARQLAEALGRPAEPPVLRALALVSIVRSEFGNACELGEQLRQLAEQRGDTTLFVEAHYVLGVSYFWLGEFEAARRHLEQALESYDPAQRREHVALYAQDPAVICRVRLAYTLWYLGRPDQAQSVCEAALTLGREVGHPFSLAYALNFAAWYANESRNRPLTRELVAATQALATEQSFSLWAMMSGFIGAWTQAEDGATETGIEQIQSGMLTFQQQGASLGRTYYLALLAKAYALVGQVSEALSALDEALALEASGEEHWYAAELHRLRGELLFQAGGSGPEVEACYQRAITIAQRQAAKPLELRAALSLSRLWQRQGRAVAARQVLQAAYAHFSEGFDTPDLAEARAQLQALT